jgi:hypothetical protein
MYGCGKLFEVAVLSLNHVIITSFLLHNMCPRTPKPEPSRVGKTVKGCCCMMIHSISMWVWCKPMWAKNVLNVTF